MSIQIGIDLGTTNSVVACFRRGRTEIIPIDGKRTFPSVLSIRGRELLVGNQAKSRLLIDPRNSIASTKRDIGKDVIYSIGNMPFTPEDVAFNILKAIREKTSEYLGEEVEDAVITVPAYFTSEQRESTQNAAKKAGFNVLRLMPEPTAAALDYGIDQNKDQIIMVYDLGGGTFDISIVRVCGNEFEVLAVDGDSHLGGDDFDKVIADILMEDINRDLGIYLKGNLDKKYIGAITKIKEAAEKAKIDLTEMDETNIMLPNLLDDYCLDRNITREEFNSRAMFLVNKTISKVDNVLNREKLTKNDIDSVILVGGSTKMPIIKEVITNRVKEPYIAENVDEVIARGAALMAYSLTTPDEEKGNSKIDLKKEINVIEKTVFTYGIDMLNEFGELFYEPIIKRGTNLPASGGVIGSTSRPYQCEVVMEVFRGESPDIRYNEYLGKLSLGLEASCECALPVLALFEIDENMIITFRSAQIPLREPYIKLIYDNDIELLKYCVDNGEFNSTEVKIDANVKVKRRRYGRA